MLLGNIVKRDGSHSHKLEYVQYGGALCAKVSRSLVDRPDEVLNFVRVLLEGASRRFQPNNLADQTLISVDHLFHCPVFSRKKGMLTRDKCKLYLKQHCDSSVDGIWRVKVLARKLLNQLKI